MPAAPLHILIIDDQATEHALYEDYLTLDKKQDYFFLHAYSGAEGEALYNQHASSIDCLLLDYRLPDMDGLEVLQHLTEKNTIVPAVMLTGDGSETVAVRAMQNGSQDYLPKRAVTPQSLHRTVERAAERVRLLRQMEAYKSELERSNHDLERFATVAAHDLKAPLRAITGHLELVKKFNAHLDEKSLQSIAFAVDGAVRMRTLVDALLEYSRLSFGEKKVTTVDCGELMREMNANLSACIAECDAQIHWQDLPSVTGDRTQLLQLFQNLVSNALKFRRAIPRIDISARRVQMGWEFSVQDNGIGIEPQHLENIFTIFRRLHSDSEYPGTGVGLAICERVALNHGGRIRVVSTPGRGSTFLFTLPEAAAESLETESAMRAHG